MSSLGREGKMEEKIRDQFKVSHTGKQINYKSLILNGQFTKLIC